MFETLTQAPADKILALMGEYAADPRSTKIDLGVGVYKDEAGNTPIFTSVKKAEARMLEGEKTKTYIGIAGKKGFGTQILDLALQGAVQPERTRVVQSVGGTGALYVLLALVARAKPDATVWLSDPTWPNHGPIASHCGLKTATYPYFDTETRGVKFDAMLAALDRLGPNDVVLLHGCCHNPTGANLVPEQWDRVAESLKRTGAIPLMDLAYMGFGDGLEEDAYGTRKVVAAVPESLVAFSGSKIFGLYKERVGAAIVIGRTPDEVAITGTQLFNVIRSVYSQPPDHGAEVIRTILADPALRKEWTDELEAMRLNMIALREGLADAMRERSNSADFDFIARHRGMFSLLGLSPAVDALKKDNGIYMTGDSRINVAGIPGDRIDVLADALAAATRKIGAAA